MDHEEMAAMVEELCGEIRANDGVKPDWMRRIDESFRNTPGCHKNSNPD